MNNLNVLVNKFDIFGYRPNFKAKKESNLHKTKLGFALSIAYIFVSILIVYACVGFSNLEKASTPDLTVFKRRILQNIYSSYHALRPTSTVSSTTYEAMFFIYIQD
jgi:hypothetical protein